MSRFIIGRILQTIPVMGVVALFIFSLLYLAPGDPAAIIAGDQANTEDIERVRIALGLDQPFLVRFFNWFLQILQGNLGTSIYTNLPVTTLIGQRLEPTILLMLMTLVVSISVAVPLGVLAAWRQGKAIDHAVMVFAILAFSVPVFVVGYLLAYVLGLKAGIAPVQGYSPLSKGILLSMKSLMLPTIALAGVYIALIARVTRAAMLDVLSQDYVRTARAKGLGQFPILFLHALKNAAIPVVSVIGLGVAMLISGTVVTESVFAVPGIGRLTIDAIMRRDYPVIQGIVLLCSFTYVIINLGIDIIYTIIDPRVRY